MATPIKETKWLYDFKVNKKEGDTKIPHRIYLKSPTRTSKENGELFYAKELSRFLKAGVLPKAIWEKIYKDQGGLESEEDKSTYLDYKTEFTSTQLEFHRLSNKPEEEKTEEDKARIIQLAQETTDLRDKMIKLESRKINAFDQAAESKARNKAIIWWVTQLGYVSTGEEAPHPIFTGKTDDDKFDQWDETVNGSEDPFWASVLNRLTYLVMYWHLGAAHNEETFKEADKDFSVEDEKPEVKTEPVVETEIKSE